MIGLGALPAAGFGVDHASASDGRPATPQNVTATARLVNSASNSLTAGNGSDGFAAIVDISWDSIDDFHLGTSVLIRVTENGRERPAMQAAAKVFRCSAGGGEPERARAAKAAPATCPVS